MEIEQVNNIKLGIHDQPLAGNHKAEIVRRNGAKVLLYYNRKWDQIGSKVWRQTMVPLQLLEQAGRRIVRYPIMSVVIVILVVKVVSVIGIEVVALRPAMSSFFKPIVIIAMVIHPAVFPAIIAVVSSVAFLTGRRAVTVILARFLPRITGITQEIGASQCKDQADQPGTFANRTFHGDFLLSC